jgi:hypothetical protein
MNGKYITTQIRIASLSHRKNNTTQETKEKVADLSQYTIVWKKKKARQKEMKVLIDF